MKVAKSNQSLIHAIVLFIIVISSVAYFSQKWKTRREWQANDVLDVAKTAGTLMPQYFINQINAEQSDIGKAPYEILKSKLGGLILINRWAKSAYILRQKENKLLFIVSSASKDSRDYSPPGAEYENKNLIQNLQCIIKNEGGSIAPISNGWIYKRSAFVPIKDELTKKVIAVLGIDYYTDEFNNVLNFIRDESLISLLIIPFLLYFLLRIKCKNKILKTEINDRKDADFQLGKKNKELLKSNADLEDAKNIAEEHVRLKSAFLANMSHEIRTPMNGIMGFAEVLKNSDLTNDERDEFLEIINKSGRRMLNIINDIIAISKVESGNMEIFLKTTNINEQIDYIYTFFKPEAEIHGVLLILNKTLPTVDTKIYTDKEKLYAVLTNLVKNAIKFTRQGNIEIGYERKGDFWEFYVKDTGIGIAPEKQKIIFERFRQASESLSRNYEGAGLGLSISKSYVEMLGGEIWVQSQPGEGSVFYFTIPHNHDSNVSNLMTSDIPIKRKKLDSDVNNLVIAIAEDDNYSAALLKKLIEPYSREIIWVKTGEKIVETCRKRPDIDLVFMDIHMPELDGFAAVRQIRQFNNNVIIIAQTAFVLPDDREKSLAASCNDYISKPIIRTVLINLINKYFGKQKSELVI